MKYNGHQEHAAKRTKGFAFVFFASFVLTAFHSVPARAELIFFADGRSMSIKAHHAEGTSMVLTLRGGGELVCDASLIARVEPDEVPYPLEIRPVPDPATADPVNANVRGIRLQSDLAGLWLQPDQALIADAELQSDPRYDPIIERASAKHGVPATLVRAVIQVESNYQARARSSKGAKGLMQLMPATARQYGLSNPYDPAANIEAGIKHLKSLLTRFPLELALAAYNSGEATIERFRGIPPYRETRSYVDRILKLAGLS